VRLALPLSLIAFAVLYFATVVLTDLPNPGDPDAETAAFYADSGNRAQEIVAAYLAAGAGVVLILIVALVVSAMRQRGVVGLSTSLPSSLGQLSPRSTSQRTPHS
jgi:hypothetical protein